jgi:tetratricopeptide (TPR) repeat protein
MGKLDRQLERNLKGREYELSNQIDKAIELYEQNVKEQFDGSFPYNRLSIIYKGMGQIDSEIRILEQAVNVFTKVAKQGRGDGQQKLEKFEERLSKAQKRRNSN